MLAKHQLCHDEEKLGWSKITDTFVQKMYLLHGYCVQGLGDKMLNKADMTPALTIFIIVGDSAR